MNALAERYSEPADAVACEQTSHSETALVRDAEYVVATICLQSAQWQQAAELLAALAGRYPASARLQEMNERLQLHLSAESTWSQPERHAARSRLSLRRAFLIGNAIVYPLAVASWLLGRAGHIL